MRLTGVAYLWPELETTSLTGVVYIRFDTSIHVQRLSLVVLMFGPISLHCKLHCKLRVMMLSCEIRCKLLTTNLTR